MVIIPDIREHPEAQEIKIAPIVDNTESPHNSQ